MSSLNFEKVPSVIVVTGPIWYLRFHFRKILVLRNPSFGFLGGRWRGSGRLVISFLFEHIHPIRISKYFLLVQTRPHCYFYASQSLTGKTVETFCGWSRWKINQTKVTKITQTDQLLNSQWKNKQILYTGPENFDFSITKNFNTGPKILNSGPVKN